MATEIRNRRETGPAFLSSDPVATKVGVNFRVTGATGIFNLEADQAYFWTEEWQAGEREADADIAAGRLRNFQTAEGLLEHFRELR